MVGCYLQNLHPRKAGFPSSFFFLFLALSRPPLQLRYSHIFSSSEIYIHIFAIFRFGKAWSRSKVFAVATRVATDVPTAGAWWLGFSSPTSLITLWYSISTSKKRPHQNGNGNFFPQSPTGKHNRRRKNPSKKIMGEHTIDYLLHWGEPSTSVSRPDSSEASSFSSCWSYCGENYKATNTSAPLSLLASWGFFSGSITAHLTEPRCHELLAQHGHGSNC